MKQLAAVLLVLTIFAVPVAALAATPVATPTGYAHPDWLADSTWLEQHLDDDNLAVIALTPPDDFAAGTHSRRRSGRLARSGTERVGTDC